MKKWNFRKDVLGQYINDASNKTFQDVEDRLNYLEDVISSNIISGQNMIVCDRCGCKMPYTKERIKSRTERRYHDYSSDFWKVEYVECVQCGKEIEIGTNKHRTIRS